MSLVAPRIATRLAGSILIPILLRTGVAAPAAQRVVEVVPPALNVILNKIKAGHPVTPEEIQTIETIRLRDAQNGYGQTGW